MTLHTGDLLQERYRIVSLLGQGGMGAVYRAWDTNLNIPVALKEMIPAPQTDSRTLAQLRQQFKREAQVVAGLDHPNLVRVTDYFSWGSSECLVMNFVEGESLAERIQREGALPEVQVLEWARQLLDALAHCHARGVIHRDIKPWNVIITPERKPVLVDFGLVKLWDPLDPRTQTVIQAMGTPEYAPPEQYSATAEHTDSRSDLYSLGATLYHALTGQAPMSATDRMALPEQFVTPRVLSPHVSLQTETVILRSLEMPISQRFSTARDMANALRSATPPSPAEKRARLPVWAWGLGGVVLLALFIGCSVGIRAILSVTRDNEQTNVLHTPAVTRHSPVPEPTPTLQTIVTTSTPAPAPTQALPTATPAPPTPVSFSIVFDSYRDDNWEVYAVSENGSNPINLTNNPADDGDPAWSSDGQRIAFDSDRDGNWEVYVMNTDGSGVTRLTHNPAEDDSPAWSLGGSHIAFKSNRDGNWEIYVVNLDDLNATNLTNHPANDQVPAWSPDGQRIAFASDRTEEWDIWVMNADGSGPVNLTNHPAKDFFPAWSHNGRRIAFHSYRDDNAEIYVMNDDGSGLVRLTNHPADDWGPSWSPDGLRLAFTSDRDGDNEIYVMDTDGGNVVQVTYNSVSDTWPVWSPPGHNR